MTDILRKIVVVILVASLAASVSACGRKGKLERLPEDKPIERYPTH